jgi:hypothetical protein
MDFLFQKSLIDLHFHGKRLILMFCDQKIEECMKMNKFADFGIFQNISDIPLYLENLQLWKYGFLLCFFDF